jgi:hypothetical protein
VVKARCPHCPSSSSPCLQRMLMGIERNKRGRRRRRTFPASRGPAGEYFVLFPFPSFNFGLGYLCSEVGFSGWKGFLFLFYRRDLTLESALIPMLIC